MEGTPWNLGKDNADRPAGAEGAEPFKFKFEANKELEHSFEISEPNNYTSTMFSHLLKILTIVDVVHYLETT